MRTGLFVSIAAALALMISIPSGAQAAKPGKQCGGIAGIQCDAGQFCQFKPGHVRAFRPVRHLHAGAEILHQDLPPGLRLRRQDLRQ